MQVSVEATEGLQRKMTVQVPAERVEGEVESRLKSMVRNVRVDGFRPGKAPLRVVKQRYGANVRDEVVGELIQSTFHQAIVEQKLQLAGPPAVEASDASGGGVEYVATFEVYPEFEVQPFNGIKVERLVAEVADTDVDAMIERLRKQRANWEPVERAAAEGDRVMIDFKGFVDGEAFPGGEGKNQPLEIGSGSFIPGFEEQLVGTKAGDEVTVEVSFPEDYRVSTLAGKASKFEVKVISVSESKLPEVDDEFASAFGVSEGGVEGLRNEVRNNMQRELSSTLKQKVKQQVMDGLLETNPLELPNAMVEQEVENLRRETVGKVPGAQAGGINLPRELFEEQARKRVALGLLVLEVVNKNEIKADADKVRASIEEMAASYEKPEDVVNWYYSNREYLSRVESSVLEEQVVDFILGQAQVSDKNVTFDEVMNPVAKG